MEQNEGRLTVYDFQDDGELYQNRCLVCGVVFLGYKMRTRCKTCTELSTTSTKE